MSKQKDKITDKINPHYLPTVTLQIYWVLEHFSTSGKDRFTPTEIANILVEEVHINTSRQAVGYAIKKFRKEVNKGKLGYKLMQPGKDRLAKVVLGEKIALIDPDTPFTAKSVTIKKVIGKIHRKILINDPYVDVNTLSVILRNFEKGIPIKILTTNLMDKPKGDFKRALCDINREGFLVEVRIYEKRTLHDRYVISDTGFWLLGTSLNYLGKKESFIVLLEEDIRLAMLSVFNFRWKNARAI